MNENIRLDKDITSEKPVKIFEDFPEADCNSCAPYWLSQCDGTSDGSKLVCTAFTPVRSVKIPAEIEAIRERLKWLNVALILNGIALVAHLLSHIFGWV